MRKTHELHLHSHARHIHFVVITTYTILCAFWLGMGGCGLTPTYTVRVENESSKAVLARLERRPSMNNMIVLDSARVNGESSKVLGPAQAPPLERVYIVIQSPDNIHSLPESHKISRGNWVVTISDGSINSWGVYDISVRKE